MRSDEEFVKDAIIKSLPHPPTKTIPGGNSTPDFVMQFDTKAVGLEVTTLSGAYLLPDGSLGNGRTVDEFLFRITEDLNREFSSHVAAGQFLMVHFEGPVANPAEYRRGLWALFAERLHSSGFGNEKFETFCIAGHKLEIRQHSQTGSTQRKIVGMVSNRNSIVNIGHHAELLLTNAVIRKSQILKRSVFKGDFWLGMLNAYFMADSGTYRRALSNMAFPHSFSKIFVVSLDGTVENIMTSDKT